jgi:hypothetical protein
MEPVALSLSENGRDVKKNPPASLRAGLETMLRIGEGSITALLGGRQNRGDRLFAEAA